MLLCRNILLVAGFLSLAESIFASRLIQLISAPATLLGNEDYLLVSSASGFSSDENIYIKGAFYKDGSSNYFGYSKNGDSYIKNSEATTLQRSVKVSAWDGNIVLRSDFSDSGYQGEGEYKVKLGFYYTTTTGSLSSVNWSANSLSVLVSEPDPTPTPVPTLTPTPTAQPSPTPTRTPTPTPTPTNALTITATPTINQRQLIENTSPEPFLENSLDETDETMLDESVIESSGGAVLGTDTILKSTDETKNLNSMISVFFGFFAAGFGVFSLASVVYVLRNHSLS